MIGKYSPTISKAYKKNQNWFENFTNNGIYDKEGYDSYGYNENDRDRAGYKDFHYLDNEKLYDDILEEYDFDGEKPVCVKNLKAKEIIKLGIIKLKTNKEKIENEIKLNKKNTQKMKKKYNLNNKNEENIHFGF